MKFKIKLMQECTFYKNNYNLINFSFKKLLISYQDIFDLDKNIKIIERENWN